MTDAPLPGPRIEAALAYWERLRGSRPMPSRADIDPIELPPPLSATMLVDVLRDPLDFRFRLIGADIEAITSSNYRGVRFSELVHMRPGSKVFGEYRTVAEMRKPLWSEIDYVGFDSGIRRIHHALLPLSDDGETVDTVLAIVHIER